MAKRLNYETTTTEVVVDHQTGEVVSESTSSTTQAFVDTEPDYIKVYFGCLCRFTNLSEAFNPILIALCKHMSYAPEQIIYINSYTKKIAGEECGVTPKRIEQAVRKFCAVGIFTKVQNGVYRVNPQIIGRGKWQDIKKLRATYDFLSKTVTTDVEYKE